jgi:uncharacterized cupredoxin-like copper-binding protein
MAVALLATVLMAACSGATASEGSSHQPAATTTAPKVSGTPINVSLGETDMSHMYMKIDRTTVPAGAVTFTVTNDGVKTHEFVVLKTDTAAADFAIGSFEGEKDRMDEEAPGTENVGETGDMESGTAQTLTLRLKPGHYALVCNLPGHYRMGMFADFEVS